LQMDTSMPLVSNPGLAIRLRIGRGVAGLFIEHASGAFDWKDAVESLAEAIQRCKKCERSIKVMFLWVLGGAMSNKVPCVGSQVHEGHHQAGDASDGESLQRVRAIMQEIGNSSWFIVGFADGCVDSLGTYLFGVSNIAIATVATRFKLPRRITSNRDALLEGFVTHVVKDYEELVAQSREQYRTLSAYTPWELQEAKRSTQPVQSLLFDLEPPPGDCPSQPPGVFGREVRGPQPLEGDSSVRSEPRHDRESQRMAAGRTKEVFQQTGRLNGPITTIMLCDLPPWVDHQRVADAIGALGFSRSYDLLLIFAGGEPDLRCGLINFLRPQDADAFTEALTRDGLLGSVLSQCAAVQPARVQGFESAIELFRNFSSRHGAQDFLVCAL